MNIKPFQQSFDYHDHRGYLFLKQLLPLEMVANAKLRVIEAYSLSTNLEVREADMILGKRCVFNDELIRDKSILQLIEHPSLVDIFKQIHHGNTSRLETRFRVMKTGDTPRNIQTIQLIRQLTLAGFLWIIIR